MIIYGKNVIREALKTNIKIKEAWILNKLDKTNDLVKEIIKKCVKINYVDKKFIDELTQGINQGLAIKIDDIKYYDIKDVIDKSKKQVFLILDEISDPHNLGAILRTCDATNVDAVIIPKNRSVKITDTVCKVSTGAVFHVKVVMANNINSAIDLLKTSGFWIYGATMEGKISYTDIDMRTSVGIVVGNEGFGISKLTKEKCDYLINIPMSGKINSLNASVSASLVLYEAYKKRINQ